eukprot:gene4218-5994_t
MSRNCSLGSHNKFKVYYDNLDYGELSSSQPFQTNILRSSLLDYSISTNEDDAIISLLTKRIQINSLNDDNNVDINAIIAENNNEANIISSMVTSSLLNAINININDNNEYVSHIGLQNELESLNTLIMQDTCKFHKQNEQPISDFHNQVNNSKSNEKRPLDNANINQVRNELKVNVDINRAEPNETMRVINEVVKKNPFQSAKQSFIAEGGKLDNSKHSKQENVSKSSKNGSTNRNSPDLPPELEMFEKALVERIEADIVHRGQPVLFQDISGLNFAKKCVTELICWPMLRPDLFQGLRALPRGLLLFGPPGTGKTLIGKAIAHQAGATFFSISASTLTSKWIGEGEKTVRVLFAVASYRQPSVVFLDEVDSLLCQRSSEENEASRRIKTEFLIQLDGAGTDQSARVVIVGATNRPYELDEAVRRRFVKRIYIPLPDAESREQLLLTLLRDIKHDLDQRDIDELVLKTDGFSGADIRSLSTEAAMGPVREIASLHGDLNKINIMDVPSITMRHFNAACSSVTPSVSPGDLQKYIEWNETFGSFRRLDIT